MVAESDDSTLLIQWCLIHCGGSRGGIILF